MCQHKWEKQKITTQQTFSPKQTYSPLLSPLLSPQFSPGSSLSNNYYDEPQYRKTREKMFVEKYKKGMSKKR